MINIAVFGSDTEPASVCPVYVILVVPLALVVAASFNDGGPGSVIFHVVADLAKVPDLCTTNR